MNFCPFCGTRRVINDAVFCHGCGKRFQDLKGGSSSSGGGGSHGSSYYSNGGGSSGTVRTVYRNMERGVENGIKSTIEKNFGPGGLGVAKEIGKMIGISGGNHPKWSPGQSAMFCCQCQRMTFWKRHRRNCKECGHRYCGRRCQGTNCGQLGSK